MGTMVVHNRTNFLFKMTVTNCGWFSIREASFGLTTVLLRPGKKCELRGSAFNTSVEFIKFCVEGNIECGFEGERTIGKIPFISNVIHQWKSIALVPRGNDGTHFQLKGLTLRTDSAIVTAWENAYNKVEAVASFSAELEKDLKQVVIYRAQCTNLVQFCFERVQKIKELLPLISFNRMWMKYELGELQPLANSLDNLLRAFLSARKLLKGCDRKEWRRAALVLSLPPPDPQKYSGSKFAHVIRELGWSFDMVHYTWRVLDTTYFSSIVSYWDDRDDERDNGVVSTTDVNFDWDDGRDRYVLQGHEPENGAPNDEMELLEGDRDREIFDHEELMKDLDNGSFRKDNTFLSLARWSKISHHKFAETIQNRSWKRDIDDADLRKKKLLGKGASKEVHKGKWLGLEVAIATFMFQQITPREGEGVESDEVLSEFRREAEFMATVHHPNVVEFFGCAAHKDQQAAFLVMELMEEDLGALIDRIMNNQARRSDLGGPFSLPVTVDILLQIVEAMCHSHKHQVMHRDLKPGNCLVSKKATLRNDIDAQYTVKVTDFGISKFWNSELDIHSYQKGTIHYMAPEVWTSGGQYTCSVDVYSFGMLCYKVITGRDPRTSPPFNRRMKVEERYELLRNGVRPIFPATCSESLSILMRKCWAPTPTNRPTFRAIRRELWDFRLLIEAQCVPKAPTVIVFEFETG